MRAPGEQALREPSQTGAVPDHETARAGERNDVGRLKRRADFLHVARGRRWHGKAVTLQAAARAETAQAVAGPRIGFTLTKKVGCAVVRNRARRRLREAVRLSIELSLRDDHDYVMVGRIEAIRMSFEELKQDLARAAHRVHDASEGGRPGFGKGKAKLGQAKLGHTKQGPGGGGRHQSDRKSADRKQADRKQADRKQADRTSADRTSAERKSADRKAPDPADRTKAVDPSGVERTRPTS